MRSIFIPLMRGYGGIGRRARFRIWYFGVQVRPLLPAPNKIGHRKMSFFVWCQRLLAATAAYGAASKAGRSAISVLVCFRSIRYNALISVFCGVQ